MENIKVNVQDLAKAVSAVVGESQKKTRTILDAVDAVVKEQLKQANENTTVEVKVMNGLTLVAEHTQPREARNPATGETFMTEPKNRVKTKLGSSLKAAANE